MKIVTHNAKFHTDDVFGVAALLILYPNAEIIRTREKDVIEAADIVLDVGDVYDPEANRFDHHQAGGAGRRENGIPYASVGLVWKKFGAEISGSQEVAERIDRTLIQSIDAPDNGMDVVVPKFQGAFPFTIGSVVDTFRATWKEDGDWDSRFAECVKWAKSLLERYIKIEKDIIEGERIVLKAYQEAQDKRLVVIDGAYDLGRELVTSVLSRYPDTLYSVLYRSDHDNWQLVAIRKNNDTFESRKPLPEAWRAKSASELETITGVKGFIFCHRSGFMCVAETKEGILQLAKAALNA